MIDSTLNYNWIAGEKVIFNERFNIENPATGERIGEVPLVGEEETKRAIDAASHAFPGWSQLPAQERSNYLFQWAENLLKHKQELASILTEEQGKPMAEALGEIEGSASFINWYAEEAKRVAGEILPGSHRNQRIMVIRQPVGVCALITPWNFPGVMVARKTAPALAAGCTVILKPSSQTPRIAIAYFEQLIATGIPQGTANLLTGNAALIGKTFLQDERVRKISFTGSSEVGKILMSQAAHQVKRLSLELGGNSPAIIFPDSNLEQAAEAIVSNKFENCGQVCNGINLIYAHCAIEAELTEKIVQKVKQLKIGQGNNPNVQLGPLIDEKAVAHLERLILDAKVKGAHVRTGGYRLKEEPRGCFFSPAVLSQVSNEMHLTKEEIFGPIAPILTFETEDEVIRRCNDTPYGLAAYLFTNDLSRAYRVSEALEAGMVAVNGTSLSVPQAPFGGIKESGMGREGGRYGLEEFLELKYITMFIDTE